MDDLQRAVSQKLALKANSRDYAERQREQARATIRDFVRTWLVEQTRFKDAKFRGHPSSLRGRARASIDSLED